MRKDRLAAQIARKMNLPEALAKAFIDNYHRAVIDSVSAGTPVTLQGFGTYEARLRKSCKRRDFAKKKTIEVPKHYTPIFKPSQKFKDNCKKLPV